MLFTHGFLNCRLQNLVTFKMPKQPKSSTAKVKACFHYECGKEHSLFVLLIFFVLTSILTACFNQRSIKETKNALFHTRSGNGPLGKFAVNIQMSFWQLQLVIYDAIFATY